MLESENCAIRQGLCYKIRAVLIWLLHVDEQEGALVEYNYRHVRVQHVRAP